MDIPKYLIFPTILLRFVTQKRFFNVLLTVHRNISIQYEQTGCTIYFQFISVINHYIFRAGLLFIISRYSTPILPTTGQCKRMTYTNCCIYRLEPPDDEQ